MSTSPRSIAIKVWLKNLASNYLPKYKFRVRRTSLFLFLLVGLFSLSLHAEFSANVTEAPVNSSVTLTWSSSASSCSAFGEWSGTKSGSGSEAVNVPSLGWNMYGLSCNFNFEYVWVWGTEASTTPTNSAPTINGLPSSVSVAENQTAVTTVSASDSDGDTLTYSLSGSDSGSLSISSSGVITFNSAPDYETKTTYSVTVNVSDNNTTTSQALTIYITDVNENGGNSSNSYSTEAQRLIDLGWNSPSANSTFLYASNISQSTKTLIEQRTKEMQRILGDYPFTLYGITSEDSTLNQPLRDDLCNKMNYSDCPNKENTTGNYLYYLNSDRSASRGFTSPAQKQRFLIVKLDGNSDDTSEIQDERRTSNLLYAYSNVYLQTLLLGVASDTGSTIASSTVPYWFQSGFPRFFRNVFNCKNSTCLNWDGPLQLWKGQTGFDTARSLQEMKSSYPSGGEEYVSATAVAYMVSKSSVQDVFVGFIRDLPLKGWNQAFVDNIGLSESQFYNEFTNFLNQSTAVQENTLFPNGLWDFSLEIEESHYSAPSSGHALVSQNLVEDGWNRSSSASVMVSKDVDLRWKNTVKSILADVGEILGKHPVYFYNKTTESDSTDKQPLKEDLCRKAKITTSNCEGHFLSGYIDDNSLASYTIPGFSPPVSIIVNTNNPVEESEILGTISTSPNERVYPIYLYVGNYLKHLLLDKTSTSAEYPKWIYRGLSYFFAVRIEGERISNAGFGYGHWLNANTPEGPIYESIPLERMEGWESSDWSSHNWRGNNYSALAIEYLIHKSSVQKVYVDFPRDIYLKGWTQSFQDNFGFTPAQFYSDFSAFIDQVKNDSDVLKNTFYPNGTTDLPYRVEWELKDEIDITAESSGGSNSNTAPTINGLPNSISVAENQKAVTTVSASDSDGDALTYTLSGTDASALSISASGVITFNSAPDYETKNSYSITVNVSDGTVTTSKALTINITDVNESSGSSSITVSTGAEVSLAFKSAPDFENPQDANQDNYYKVTINVSDGQETISREITVRIDDVQD